MTAIPNRLQQLTATVDAWSAGENGRYFPKLDAGLLNRLAAGKPRPVDYETIKAASAQADANVPMFMSHDVVDVMTHSFVGYAHDLGLLRKATADALGIKEHAFPRLAAFMAGIHNALTGA